jgi:hypothetical protein
VLPVVLPPPLHAGFLTQVVKNEGVKSLFKGAGANILRAVAGAGVLSGYDQMQVIMFGEFITVLY